MKFKALSLLSFAFVVSCGDSPAPSSGSTDNQETKAPATPSVVGLTSQANSGLKEGTYKLIAEATDQDLAEPTNPKKNAIMVGVKKAIEDEKSDADARSLHILAEVRAYGGSDGFMAKLIAQVDLDEPIDSSRPPEEIKPPAGLDSRIVDVIRASEISNARKNAIMNGVDQAIRNNRSGTAQASRKKAIEDVVIGLNKASADLAARIVAIVDDVHKLDPTAVDDYDASNMTMKELVYKKIKDVTSGLTPPKINAIIKGVDAAIKANSTPSPARNATIEAAFTSNNSDAAAAAQVIAVANKEHPHKLMTAGESNLHTDIHGLVERTGSIQTVEAKNKLLTDLRNIIGNYTLTPTKEAERTTDIQAAVSTHGGDAQLATDLLAEIKKHHIMDPNSWLTYDPSLLMEKVVFDAIETEAKALNLKPTPFRDLLKDINDAIFANKEPNPVRDASITGAFNKVGSPATAASIITVVNDAHPTAVKDIIGSGLELVPNAYAAIKADKFDSSPDESNKKKNQLIAAIAAATADKVQLSRDAQIVAAIAAVGGGSQAPDVLKNAIKADLDDKYHLLLLQADAGLKVGTYGVIASANKPTPAGLGLTLTTKQQNKIIGRVLVIVTDPTLKIHSKEKARKDAIIAAAIAEGVDAPSADKLGTAIANKAKDPAEYPFDKAPDIWTSVELPTFSDALISQMVKGMKDNGVSDPDKINPLLKAIEDAVLASLTNVADPDLEATRKTAIGNAVKTARGAASAVLVGKIEAEIDKLPHLKPTALIAKNMSNLYSTIHQAITKDDPTYLHVNTKPTLDQRNRMMAAVATAITANPADVATRTGLLGPALLGVGGPFGTMFADIIAAVDKAYPNLPASAAGLSHDDVYKAIVETKVVATDTKLEPTGQQKINIITGVAAAIAAHPHDKTERDNAIIKAVMDQGKFATLDANIIKEVDNHVAIGIIPKGVGSPVADAIHDAVTVAAATASAGNGHVDDKGVTTAVPLTPAQQNDIMRDIKAAMLKKPRILHAREEAIGNIFKQRGINIVGTIKPVIDAVNIQDPLSPNVWNFEKNYHINKYTYNIIANANDKVADWDNLVNVGDMIQLKNVILDSVIEALTPPMKDNKVSRDAHIAHWFSDDAKAIILPTLYGRVTAAMDDAVIKIDPIDPAGKLPTVQAAIADSDEMNVTKNKIINAVRTKLMNDWWLTQDNRAAAIKAVVHPFSTDSTLQNAIVTALNKDMPSTLSKLK